MFLDELLNEPEIAPTQPIILSQLDPRLHPELGFTLRAMDVHVHSRLFPRKEEEAKASFSEDSRAHVASSSTETC
jgi:hypothetical protein